MWQLASSIRPVSYSSEAWALFQPDCMPSLQDPTSKKVNDIPLLDNERFYDA